MSKPPSPDSQWVREALDRFEGPLLRYATRITGNPEVARDVVQDTFLRLWTADRQKLNGRLAPWLYTVCRNRAIDVAKKEGRMTPSASVQITSPAPDPGAAAERRETHALILDAVAQLPPDQQEVFQFKFQDGLTYREISRISGKSLGAVSKLMAEALDDIRIKLHEHNQTVMEG